MKLFDRLANGWKLGKTSLTTIKENPSLMVFPLISGFSLLLVSISFFGTGYIFFGKDILALANDETAVTSLNVVMYVMAFLFYLINYFVIVFFNVGLVYCAKNILEGREATVRDGVRFAQSRMGSILAWSVLAATVGLILKSIQERAGAIGVIITGLIGVVWGIATFFVIPVVAFENVSPIEAVKKSALIMKEKWGESIGANFSFAIFTLLGIFVIVLPIGFFLGATVHPIAGIVAAVLAFLLVQTAVSSANMVFLAAAYQHVNGESTGNFDSEILDEVFIPKK